MAAIETPTEPMVGTLGTVRLTLASGDETAHWTAVLRDAGFTVSDTSEDDASTVDVWIVDRSLYREGLDRPTGALNRPAILLVVEDGPALAQAIDGLPEDVDDVLVRPIDPRILPLHLRLARRRVVEAREVAAARDRMQAELTSARRVQQAMLPQPHFRAPGTRLAWDLRPCTELAGDLLNFVRVDEHHLAFYVIDVCGHGVSSALLGAQVARMMSPVMSDSTLLKEPLPEAPWYRIVEPARVLEKLNATFQADSANNLYFTMAYGLMHVASGRLRVAGAAHPPVVIQRLDGRSEQIVCAGLPIGLFDKATYAETETTIEAGERIWCYSDGLVEAPSAEREEFGLDRLVGVLGNQRRSDVDEALTAALGEVDTWCLPAGRDDDCSLLVVEREAPVGPPPTPRRGRARA